MTSSEQPVKAVDNLSVSDEGKTQSESEVPEMGFGIYGGVCAICLDKIVLQETAFVEGCEHAYCVTCILRWASCNQNVTCPQCKHPFEFLNVHRSLDGSSSSLGIVNRRWEDDGYVRAGRQEARAVHRPNSQTSGASSSREPKKDEVAKGMTGRRAKRALKREAADKAAAAKHQ